jgi:hypothetical protein
MPQPRGESWKARAREREETVQAPTVGITDFGADRVVTDKAQTYWPRLEGLAPWFLRNANCPDTYELLNKSRRETRVDSTIECELALENSL